MRILILVLVLLSALASAGQITGERPPQPVDQTPLYRITVVGRTTKAINYKHRSGPTRIDFRGTVLLPDARGEARVEARQGATAIDARFEGLAEPTRFGRQHLTYVLWAITPDGRATNLGELVTDHKDKARLKATSELQAFALVVTAEPYYAVTQPSDVVVMENKVRSDTTGNVELIDAKYGLLRRGSVTLDIPSAESRPPETGGPKVGLDEYEALLELYQARNAVQIAKSLGADRDAADTIRKAEALLQEAEGRYQNKGGYRQVVMTARQATQTAEDARLLTMKQQEERRAAGQASLLRN